jgi:hypothetical protein
MEYVEGEDYERMSREVELGDDFEEESFDMESLDEYDDGMGGPARDRGHSADAGLDEIIRMLKQLKMKGGELSKEALRLIKDKMNLGESNLNENEEDKDGGGIDDLDDDELSGFEADAEDGQELSLHLQQALELAKELGDEKLITQIGNTITFYTRNNILK